MWYNAHHDVMLYKEGNQVYFKQLRSKPRICEKHQIEKTVKEFCARCINQTAYRCPECNRERYQAQNARTETKLRQRNWALRKNYGLTAEAYNTMVAEQGGICSICKRPPHTKGKNGNMLLVDHDHKTGVVRGLLCHDCNRMLAEAQDNPSVLRAAANYLENYS
jgi:hypothetical protein